MKTRTKQPLGCDSNEIPMVNEICLPRPLSKYCALWNLPRSKQLPLRLIDTGFSHFRVKNVQRFFSAIQCSPFNLLLRSYINNSCFVFHERFQTPRLDVVLSSVSRCLEPLMKYSHSLIYYFLVRGGGSNQSQNCGL